MGKWIAGIAGSVISAVIIWAVLQALSSSTPTSKKVPHDSSLSGAWTYGIARKSCQSTRDKSNGSLGEDPGCRSTAGSVGKREQHRAQILGKSPALHPKSQPTALASPGSLCNARTRISNAFVRWNAPECA